MRMDTVTNAQFYDFFFINVACSVNSYKLCRFSFLDYLLHVI